MIELGPGRDARRLRCSTNRKSEDDPCDNEERFSLLGSVEFLGILAEMQERVVCNSSPKSQFQLPPNLDVRENPTNLTESPIHCGAHLNSCLHFGEELAMLLSVMSYLCLWTVVLGGILDVDQPRAIETDVEPVEWTVVQDSPPCPLYFMFQYGSFYYYSAFQCNPNNNCEPGAASAAIKYYSRRVAIGCKTTEDGCGCINQFPPSGEFLAVTDRRELSDANGFFAKGDSTTVETQLTNQFVVKARVLNANNQPTDVWFRTVRVELFHFENQQRFLDERIAVMVNDQPDPAIVGPYGTIYGRYSQNDETLTILLDGSQVIFRVTR
ncbi:MAG TPA: hypothetical protein PKD54_10190 [Pirellulaceae bacterium]|nr:hypothetical protein [Pirellulaceae bacterium]